MCGIAGYTGKINSEALKAMIAAIRHRGPDAQVTFSHEEVSLAHARLSILDLRPEGNQPMFTPDRKLVITFNGEIYNFPELKKGLEKKYQFTTTTDTEVLLYLYREHGTRMLDMISGMFAFAIYDFDRKELFAARDRMGKKPFYYTETPGHFIFASEIKSLLKHPSVSGEINTDAVNQYLTFDYVPAPLSIIKGIYKLEPAHYIIVRDNIIVEKAPYWRFDFTKNESLSFSEARDKLDTLLFEATERRLMSDVPLGVFLSGGLDSSAVAWYAQKNSERRIKTFSIGFEDKSYDEGSYASQVSAHLNTEHYSKILTPQETLRLIDEIYPMVDEPFADASLIPTYFLSKFTREHVTVALGGDGSDELQAGYPTFISEKFRKPVGLLPDAFIRLLLNISGRMIPVSDRNISFDFKVRQFLRGFLVGKHDVHQLWLGSFLPEEKSKLFNKEVNAELNGSNGLEIVRQHFESASQSWSDADKITYYYCKTYLPDDILVKVDRASMYNSLEVRAPFLDREVVEFYNSLPWNFKQRGSSGKYILKKVMEGKLPHEIIHRPKKGFGIPLSDWIKKDLRQSIEETLFSKDDYFDQAYIKQILQSHYSGKCNQRKLIWNLFMLKKFFKLNVSGD